MNRPAKDQTNEKGFSRSRKMIFNLIMVGFALLLIVLLEMGLRIFKYGNDLSLFVESKNFPGYYEINRDVNLRYFSKLINTSPTNDIFLQEKPDSCYRIFVFGGSTTRGFPYQASTAFPRILYYQLQDAFPEKWIEVVNLSASALNSYAYIDQIDEVLRHEPDAILVYGGHNEYYGALGVGSEERGGNIRFFKKLHLGLAKLRIYQLVQQVVSAISSGISSDDDIAGQALMQRIVKDSEILMGSKTYEKGIEQFRSNMEELVRKAKKKNVPVILSELVCNLEDHAPFQSLASDDHPAAITLYQQAKDKAEQGDYNNARLLYYQAKDLDVIRFRAPEAFNTVLREIASANELPLVRMQAIFEGLSPNGLIGKELMLEHLHPTIDGNFVMSNAFFLTMKEYGFLEEDWNEGLIRPLGYYRRTWGFTSLDSLIGDINIRYLQEGWPFKLDDTPNRFLEFYRYSGYVDSLALAYIKNPDGHIEDEHVKLAGYYANRGRPDLAYEEYKSLIKMHPYVADLYFDASRHLINQKKYREAYNLIQSAPLMPRHSHYYYVIGSLELSLNNIEEGIEHLEKSVELLENDEDPLKILQTLYVVYQETGDTENEERMLGLIRRIIPEYGKQENIMKQNLANSNVTYEDVLNRSKDLIVDNRLEDAEQLLLSLEKVGETFEVYKLLSQLYILRKIARPAYEYSFKAYTLDSSDVTNNINLFMLSLRLSDLETAEQLLEVLKGMGIEPERMDEFEERYEAKRLQLDSQ